jgi:MFS family permease
VNWRRACATYGAAHFGKSLLWTGSDLLPLYLLVSVHHVDPMTAGLVFLTGLAVNALADFGVGNWLARHPRHAAALAGGALLVAGASFPATMLLAPYGPWALLAATLTFRIAYAGCDVPHNALLSRLGDTPARAVGLARCRTMGTALASLLAAGATGMGGKAADAPFLMGIAAGGILMGSAMIPLLISLPPTSRTARSTPSQAHDLPMPFLLASVIGIVALGALSKAVLHLPSGWNTGYDGTSVLTFLILGRTASALLPIRLRTVRHGFRLLGATYAATVIIVVAFVWSAGAGVLAMLGLALGASNLIGWAMLPVLNVGPRGYGLYTMASKLALGVAGLALAGGLGRDPTFTPAGYVLSVLATALACAVTALMLVPRLTPMPVPGLRT